MRNIFTATSVRKLNKFNGFSSKQLIIGRFEPQLFYAYEIRYFVRVLSN